MADIYTLGIEADTRDVDRGKKRLFELATQAKDTEDRTRAFTGAVGRMNVQLKRAASGTVNLNKGLATARTGMGRVGGVAGQLGFQLQDVAVQLQAGQNALLVFGQQGSQIASIFGPAGAVFGAVIGIGAALASAFIPSLMKSKKSAEELLEEIKDLSDGFADLTEAQRAYVVFQLEQEIANQEQALSGLRSELESVNDRIERNERIAEGKSRRDQAIQREALNALEEDREARLRLNAEVDTQNQKLAELSERLQDVKNDTVQSSESAKQAEKDFKRFASGVAAASEAAAAFAAEREKSLDKQFDALDRDIERTIQSLKTQEEIERERYRERLMFLETATDEELETLGGFHAAKERLEQEHQERMAQIASDGFNVEKEFAKRKEALDQQTVAAQQALGDSLVGLVESMAGRQSAAYKIAFLAQQAFAVATTFVNTQMAAAAALAPPPIGLGPVAGLPLAGKIETIGALQIAAIAARTIGGLVSGGGSNVSSGSSAPSQGNNQQAQQGPQPTPQETEPRQQVVINLNGEGPFSRREVLNLLEEFNEAIADGAKIRVS